MVVTVSDEQVFPIGTTLDGGRWRIVEVVRGDVDRGQLRAVGKEGTGLVTIAPPQHGDAALFTSRIAWESPGITPLVWSGSVAGEGVRYDVIVESHPKGVSVDAWDGCDQAARSIARQLADTIREAHDRGLVLGGLRPELVFVADDTLTAIAPRAQAFFANATERDYGVPPCFEHVYLSPEQLALRPPGPPADIFALGATLARLLTGQAPFAGSTIMERMSAALHARHASLDSASALAPLLTDMMHIEPAARPSIETVCAALAS